MASTLDRLIERLLYDVALSGSQGIGPHQFENAVKEFYAQQKTTEQNSDQQDDDDLLFSAAPPANEVTIDEAFIDYVFNWLCKHPDVEIKDASTHEVNPSTYILSKPSNLSVKPTISSNLKNKLDGKCIRTTDDRVWHAITGHGVDAQRVPPKEFECLSVIASSGLAGVLQPELVRLTGQDKRSVPHRTDCLAQKGYITKENVIGQGSKTSLLKLRKFTQGNPFQDSAKLLPAGATSSIRVPVIFYDKWYNETLRMLKENNNVISMEDLRIGLGIHQRRWERKALLRCVRRLEDRGCIRRFTAEVQDREGNALRKVATAQAKLAKAIQLVREPTEYDRLLWTQSAPKIQPPAINRTQSTDNVAREDDAADSDDGPDTMDFNDASDLDLIQQRIPPQWTSTVLYTNLLFDVVDQAGPSGISSMNLCALATGPVWRRPLDEVMGKLTDVWRFSQPPHLRHLTIIRDTAVHGKSAHYQYRSLANFEKAVEAGNADWNAIGGDPNDVATIAKRQWAQSGLDDQGFPTVRREDFLYKNGMASLLEAMGYVHRAADVSGPTRPYPPEGKVVSHNSGFPYPHVPKTRTYKLKRKREGAVTTASAAKRHKVEAKEITAFNVTAQRIAEQRALSELKKSSQSRDGQHLTRKDLPVDMVQRIKEEILAREKAGIYINPPGSKTMKQNNFFQRGRPRNSLIAVVRTKDLHQLPWFRNEKEGVRQNGPPPKSSLKRKLSLFVDSRLSGHTATESDLVEHPIKRRLVNKQRFGKECVGRSESGDRESAKPASQSDVVVADQLNVPNDVAVQTEGLQQLASSVSKALSIEHTPDGSQPIATEDDPQDLSSGQAQAQVTSKLSDLKDRLSQLRHKRGRRSKAQLDEMRNLVEDIAAFEVNLLVDQVDIDAQSLHSQTGQVQEAEQEKVQTTQFVVESSQTHLQSNAMESNGSLKASIGGKAAAPNSIVNSVPRKEYQVLTPPISKQPFKTNTSIISTNSSNFASNNSTTRQEHDANAIDPHILHEVHPTTIVTPSQNSNNPDTHRHDESLAEPESSFDLVHDGNDALDSNVTVFPTVTDTTDLTPAFEVQMKPSTKPLVRPESTAKRPKKTGTRRDGGFIAAQREQCILDSIRQCNGVFPGNNEIWYAVTTFWRKKFNQTPDKHTVDRNITNLIARRKLKKLRFQFRSKKGTVQTRAMLVEPGIDPLSPIVQELQKKIKDMWPDQYLPPDVDIDPEMRQHASNMHNRKVIPESVKTCGTEPVTDNLKIIVRQTDTAAKLANEEAKLQGFPNAQALYLSQIEKHPAYRRKWESLNTTKRRTGPVNLEQQSAKPADSTLKRRPLSSLHQSMVGRGGLRKLYTQPQIGVHYLPSQLAHSCLNPQWLMSLMKKEPQRRWRYRQAVLTQNENRIQAIRNFTTSMQTFHPVSGTFGSYLPSFGSGPELVEQPNGNMDNTSPISAAGRPLPEHSAEITFTPRTLEEILDYAARLGVTTDSPGADKIEQFFAEIDAVQKCEGMIQRQQHQSSPHGVRRDGGYSFINHFMNQPMIKPVPELSKLSSAFVHGQSISPSTGLTPYDVSDQDQARWSVQFDSTPNGFQEPTDSPAPLGLPTSLRVVGSRIEPAPAPRSKPKRKYTPRARRSNVEGGRQPTTTIEGGSKPSTRTVSRLSHTHARVKNTKPRTRMNPQAFKDAERLVIAYALVTTVCGGLNQHRLNWNLISHALGYRYDSDFLRRRWAYHRRFRSKDAEKLRDAIREPFLKAYEDGKLPQIDFQNLSKTDWPAMFSWVTKEISTWDNQKDESIVTELPKSIAELETSCTVVERSDPYKQSHDDYFTIITDAGRRRIGLQLTHGNAIPTALTEESQSPGILIKSWVRAVAMTKQWQYNAKAADSKVKSLFSDAAVNACGKFLVKNRVLKQEKKNRQVPGRNFHVHNETLTTFKRWSTKQDEFKFLRAVAQTWTDIKKHLTTNNEINLVSTSLDPQYLVLFNMLAQGLLRTSARIPTRSDDFEAPFPRISPWGYSGYSYETKKANVKLLKFQIVFTKTPAYADQHDLKPGVPIPLEPPIFPGEVAARIPFWMDIHGNLMDDVWDMVLRSIIHLLVYRPGYTSEQMAAAHNHKFGAWEIELVLDWMGKVGIAKKSGEGREAADGEWRGGWGAGGFWYCAFRPEIATWKAPVGCEVLVDAVID